VPTDTAKDPTNAPATMDGEDHDATPQQNTVPMTSSAKTDPHARRAYPAPSERNFIVIALLHRPTLEDQQYLQGVVVNLGLVCTVCMGRQNQ